MKPSLEFIMNKYFRLPEFLFVLSTLFWALVLVFTISEVVHLIVVGFD